MENPSPEPCRFDRPRPRVALVTGASSGIGEATVVTLARQGWTVYAVARRKTLLEELADRCTQDDSVRNSQGAVRSYPADISHDDDVARVLASVEREGRIDTLINIAGGARGLDPIAHAVSDDWEWMYRVNVLGTMKMIRAFLPMVRASGRGTMLTVSSTAALGGYVGGGGYNAAKAGERALTQALRQEEAEHNVRVIEILPGMVKTEEFSLRRLGNRQEAAAVYEGVQQPLVAEDIAGIVAYAVSLPHHVNIDELLVRPVAQTSQYSVIRQPKR